MRRIPAYLLLLTLAASLPAAAVEVAPRISDREIIETLAQLREGQRALNEKIDTKIDAQNALMAAQFKDLRKSMDYLWGVMVVMLAGIFGLIGFVVWDRKTALRPLEQRMVRLEQEVHADLQAHHGEDSELKRLLKALRAFAAEDERFAKVLRQFSLL
ncbi:MAG TPA: hypothetical protein ENK62_03780 [Chromatiales bacterium]|nr:hypothetical protein [Chromatiales bacterium]